MADIGYIALFLALLAAAYAAAAFAIGSWKKRPPLIESARNSLLAVCGLMTVSVGVLLAALLTHQFQIEYVYLHSSTDMSTVFLVTSLWAGSEGSLLFWAWLLSVFGVIAVMARRSIGRELVPYAAAVIMFVQAFIIILILASSDPFTTLSFTPIEGTSLNPLLENIGMILHPPIHFISYAAFTIPFAFGMAALFTGRLGDEWLITIRRWTLFAWMALGISLIIGAWWAYVELNWGGYWGWDPVENAGLMPWLVATAFLHSVKMQQRRGMFKTWNIVLIILAFALTVFGTYINRTGIGQHSFGETPESIIISNLVLSFLAIIVIVATGLLIYRRRQLKGETELESFISRESTFLITTWMLVGAAAAVFVGTMLPSISEGLGSEIVVGPDFFNQVNAPLFLAIITLAGICTIIGWRKASNRNLIRNFLWPSAAALVLAVALFAFGIREVTSLVAFPLLLFVLLTILSEWFRGTRSRSHVKKENPLLAFPRLIWSNKPRYGGYIVHLGILILAMGIVGSSVYDTETTATLAQGESVTLSEYNIRYDGLEVSSAPGREWIVTADVTILKNDKEEGTLAPEKWLEPIYGIVTESAIRSTLTDDVWVTLESWGENIENATLRVLVNPLVLWIWIGGAVVVLGGLIAFWPERRSITAA